MSEPRDEFAESIDRLIGAAWKGDEGAVEAELGREDGAFAAIKRGRAHPRCELCGDNPEAQPHCWSLDIHDGDQFDPDACVARCRHCPATAEVCPDCDGQGCIDGETDCRLCEGWGVMPPGEDR